MICLCFIGKLYVNKVFDIPELNFFKLDIRDDSAFSERLSLITTDGKMNI